METATRLFLNDARWSCIVGQLQQVRSRRGRPGREDRRFVAASVWIMRTGSPWRDLPGSFGRWQTAHKRFARWAKSDFWGRVTLSVPLSFRQQQLRRCPAQRRHLLPTASAPRAVAHRAPAFFLPLKGGTIPLFSMREGKKSTTAVALAK